MIEDIDRRYFQLIIVQALFKLFSKNIQDFDMQALFEFFSRNVQVFFKLCSRFFQALFKFFPRNVQNFFKLCSRFFQGMFNFFQEIFKILSSFVQVFFYICLRFFQSFSTPLGPNLKESDTSFFPVFLCGWPRAQSPGNAFLVNFLAPQRANL